MSTLDDRIEAVAATAKAWRAPEHPARAEAAERTLASDNRFTEESVAFAINQAAHAANPTALRRWTAGRESAEPGRVGLWLGDAVPMVGWQPMLAAFLAGHEVVVRLAPSSPALLPLFARELERANGEEGRIRFDPDWPGAMAGFDVVWGSGASEDVARLAEHAAEVGLPGERVRLHGERYAVAVVGADETPEARIGIAEDTWLYGGEGPRSVRLLWAPEGLSPDPYLDAFSAFHELFPPHPDRAGALEMPRAFLKAAKASYAWGDGFLVSRGEPDVQAPGHLRWAEYTGLGAVRDWLRAQDDLALLVASPGLAAELNGSIEVVAPGDAHRPRLHDAEGQALYALLAG